MLTLYSKSKYLFNVFKIVLANIICHHCEHQLVFCPELYFQNIQS